ncbi:MAG: three-Cys-motif partner protein TcmP [Roseivirga sp.]|nr:three-Cys-motif partner protein TcmP [Roseivirga sp.]
MTKDIHKSEFDDGTKIKLEIFKEYLKSWLPTFTKGKQIWWREIDIYDFFAGEGLDAQGNMGSPLIILDELKAHHDALIVNNINLRVILNEKLKGKFQILNLNINSFQPNPPYKIITSQNSFQDFFGDQYTQMSQSPKIPRLIILDQYGIKEITHDVFRKLTRLERTDFIFFISSSFVRRFSEMEEFKNYIQINKEKFDISRPVHSHRVVFEYYKSLLDKNYHLAPFSIKKGSNVYGLIFGSNHTLGLEKFLKIAWKINRNTGDSNFNIDEEAFLETGQLSLIAEENRPKKLNLFEKSLKTAILKKELKTNTAIYNYSLDQGFLPKHANDVLEGMIKDGDIESVNFATHNIHKLSPSKLTLK